VAWCGSVMTSFGLEATPGRGKGGDNVSSADADLTRQKIKKIHSIDSVASNGQ
jgi:hypothetical protein